MLMLIRLVLRRRLWLLLMLLRSCLVLLLLWRLTLLLLLLRTIWTALWEQRAPRARRPGWRGIGDGFFTRS